MIEYLRNLPHLALSIAIFLLIGSATVFAETRQEHVHQMA